MCERICPMPRNALALILSCFAVLTEPVLAEPVVEIPFRFIDGFICIEARDPKFDRVETRKFLETLTRDVYEVEH